MARIADIKLASLGHQKVAWAWRAMPVLRHLREERLAQKPLAGCRLSACLHLEAKTACLLLALQDMGAQVYAAGSNPLSTQDDVCAALVERGVEVFSTHGMTAEQYEQDLQSALSCSPHVIVDDGADLMAQVVAAPEKFAQLRGASEETTSGVKRLKAMQKQGLLSVPVISVNDALSKYLFDNRYGTGQSVWDGVMRTNMLIAGKKVVIVGYGWCGRGAAMRARGLGAQVIVTEVNPHRAFEAVMDGYEVMPMDQAAKLGDLFLTFTGNTRVIRKEHFEAMKDNVLLGNGGHFDVEIDKKDLASLAVSVEASRPGVQTYHLADGRRLNLLGEGRLVNLALADGHPIEIMDLSFSLQFESALRAFDPQIQDPCGLLDVPDDIDRRVMEVKLSSMGLTIDHMTDEQIAYMEDWRED